ncbi:MAG TPA: hypothetical protein VGM87_17165 [Roseomonas sp.]|jgi:hypothetical protein
MRSNLLNALLIGLLLGALLAGGYWLVAQMGPHLTGVGELYA